MQLHDIGVTSNDSIGAFAKSSRRSKSQPQYLFSNFSEFSNRYNKINTLYLSDLNLTESANYGFIKQHNFISKHGLFNSSRTLIEDKAIKTFTKYNTNLDYNNLIHQNKGGQMNFNSLISTDEFPKNDINIISGKNISPQIESLNINYIKAAKGFDFSFNLNKNLISNYGIENPLPSLSNHSAQYYKPHREGYTNINAKAVLNTRILNPKPVVSYFGYTPTAQNYYPRQTQNIISSIHHTPFELKKIIPSFKKNNKDL